jgi:hypothetical protein
MSATLAAKAIKVTLVVDPAAVVAIPLRDGAPAPVVTIAAGGRSLRATFNAKSLRRTQATIRDVGPEAVAVVIQGKLGPDDEVLEAGIVATPKTPKPAEAVT